MTNQKQPQIHPSLSAFAVECLTGREPNVASIMADTVGVERDRRVAELEAKAARYEEALRTISGIPEEYASAEVFAIVEEALKL